MKTGVVTGLLACGCVGTGCWYGFSHLQPKNLKQYLEWQGFKLASYSSDNTWKSILEENKDLLSKIPELQESNLSISKIRDWCYERYGYSSFDDLKDSASKLCVDNPQTVKGKIIANKGNIDHLMKDSQTDEWIVAFVFRKHIEGFTTLVNYEITTSSEVGDVANKESLAEAGEALKSWCENALKSKPTEESVSNVETLCSPKPYKTIEQLIEFNKESNLLLTSGDNSQDLKYKYDKLKELKSFTEDVTPKKKDEDDLLEWCNEKIKAGFHEDKVFSKTYPKFRHRCLKDKGES